MKIGILLPQHTSDIAAVIDAAKMAERAGLDSLWVADHLQGRTRPDSPFVEAWTTLSAVAAATAKIGIGTLVLRVGLRSPRVLLSMVQTLSSIAPGRLTLGLGIGDATNEQEQRSYGIPVKRVEDRVNELRRLVQSVQTSLPAVPVWVGGTSKELLDLAPRVSGCNFWGPAARFGEVAALVRKTAPSAELSWAGVVKDFDPSQLIRDGADHIILATGALTYPDRIERLAQMHLDDERRASHGGYERRGEHEK